MSPSDLNTVARLALIAKRCGPDFLYDPESFDRLFGRGSFADLDCEILDMTRSVVDGRK
jgi:hypothetical protein